MDGMVFDARFLLLSSPTRTQRTLPVVVLRIVLCRVSCRTWLNQGRLRQRARLASMGVSSRLLLLCLTSSYVGGAGELYYVSPSAMSGWAGAGGQKVIQIDRLSDSGDLGPALLRCAPRSFTSSLWRPRSYPQSVVARKIAGVYEVWPNESYAGSWVGSRDSSRRTVGLVSCEQIRGRSSWQTIRIPTSFGNLTR